MKITFTFDESFEEMIRFFEKKELVITKSWKDIWKDAHARAFTVSNITSIDILEDIKKAIANAIITGQTAKEFKKELSLYLTQKGWFAGDGESSIIEMPDGTKRKRLTGWRIDNIYSTNLSSAYQTGRFIQQEEVKKYYPYRQYIAVGDKKTRKTHNANNKKIYPVDHKFWDYWYPPNGFRCRCTTRLISKARLKKMGERPETNWSSTDNYPDKGFDYHPGKAGLAYMSKKETEKLNKKGMEMNEYKSKIPR